MDLNEPDEEEKGVEVERCYEDTDENLVYAESMRSSVVQAAGSSPSQDPRLQTMGKGSASNSILNTPLKSSLLKPNDLSTSLAVVAQRHRNSVEKVAS